RTTGGKNIPLSKLQERFNSQIHDLGNTLTCHASFQMGQGIVHDKSSRDGDSESLFPLVKFQRKRLTCRRIPKEETFVSVRFQITRRPGPSSALEVYRRGAGQNAGL